MALIIVSFLCVILGMPRILQLEGINSSSSIAFSTAGLTRLTIGEDGTVAFSNSAKFEFLYVSNSIVNNDYPNTKISFTVADAIVFQTSALERIRITSLGGISFGATGTNFGASNQLLISAGNLPPSWGLVANVNVSASAAIAYTKLALGTSIVNSDISATAEIAYTKLNLDLSVVNADISATAGIVDTKLATISTAGKVSNSATTATNANTASAIVARDASGNFSAGTITAAFSGNVTGNAGTVTDGVYLSTTQTVSGRKTFTSSMAGGSLLVATGSLGPIELQTSGANASLLTFHRAGSYASYFGLDTDNQFAVGGWSAGAALANMKVGSFGVGTAASGTAGEIRATNNITAYYSDERLKDFIGKISNALEKVNSLNGYYYKECESKRLKIKKKVSARKLFSLIVKERVETGRIYILNIDHANDHGAWLDKVTMSNLCTEVIHPTIPLNDYNDKNGEIGMCILSAVNMLEIKNWQDLEKTCDLIVRFLDEIIDIQEYFNIAAENFAKKRRSLGVGITNLAAYLAKNELKYSSDKALTVLDEWMEHFQYYLLKSSLEIAKEKGKCEKFNRTKYSQGLLPIDTYKDKLDEIVKRKLSLDWEQLRKDIKEFGLRHSTLSSCMPCESSSVIQCSTNGVEPIRSLMTYKTSKMGKLPVMVPGIGKYEENYELAYDLKDNIGLLKINAVIQKYIDMAISTNVYYNYSHYENNILPDSKVMKEIMYAYSLGLISLYYNNTDDGDKEQSMTQKEDDCASGACKL